MCVAFYDCTIATHYNAESSVVTMKAFGRLRSGCSLHPVGMFATRQILIRTSRAYRLLHSWTSPSLDLPIPFVIENSGRSVQSYDIFSRLLKERIICLNGPVHDSMSAVITAQLLFLEAEDPEKPIYLYINSPGGTFHPFHL